MSLPVNQNKRVNCTSHKELKFIHFFSKLQLFLCEGSFIVLISKWVINCVVVVVVVVESTMETANIDGKKKYKLHFNIR